ncbi:MAG TPA: helix-turn-helix domain-containing protein [Burkholderiaceae bacterium]|nr:helix-turn-helix domain-containing protein [Burkholderiaceae bacterium]
MAEINLEHRQRILAGMAKAIADKGYAEITIADIVREAKVSRRTFYEHFANQSECLFALHDIGCDQVQQVLRVTFNQHVDWTTQVESAMRAYFTYLMQDLVMLRTIIVEIHKLGYEGLAARRKSIRSFAQLIQTAVKLRAEHNPKAWMSDDLATAAVGSIYEMILNEIEQKQEAQLMRLCEPACQVILALTRECI